MHTRRRFIKLSFAALLAGAGVGIARSQATSSFSHQVALPLVVHPLPTPSPTATAQPTTTPQPTATPQPTPGIPGDAAILGLPSGTVEQAIAWFSSRADASYLPGGVPEIMNAYRGVGESVGIDWFLAVAQMGHETGHLTSFWSLRPQRNPAGIGVTGDARAGLPTDPPPEPSGWAYNTQRNRWERGISFSSWAGEAVQAHLGRLLAYALRDDQATSVQHALIQQALSYRGLPASLRGSAPTWVGLNGRWAVPGTTYGQSIIDLARRMRDG